MRSLKLQKISILRVSGLQTKEFEFSLFVMLDASVSVFLLKYLVSKYFYVSCSHGNFTPPLSPASETVPA